MSDNKITLCRKLKLTILADEETRKEQYKTIRDEQYQQYRALNLCMSLKSTNYVLKSYNSGAEVKLNSQIKNLTKKLDKTNLELQKDKLKEAKKVKLLTEKDKYINDINELEKEFERTSQYRSDIDTKFNDLYVKDIYTVVQNQVNFKAKDMMSLVTQKVEKDFKNSLNNGMARGDRSLTNYKRDFPLMTRGKRWLKFKYDDNSDDIIIDWVHGIRFKVVLGNKVKNTQELRHTLHKVINEEIEICDSTLQFDNKNNLILNLVMKMDSIKNNEFVDGLVMGVDLGMKIPAVATFNNTNGSKRFGSIDDFLRIRTQMQERRRKLQIALTTVKGGKGREKKLAAMERYKNSEKKFVSTYNHTISRQIIEFAKEHKCGIINLEFLSLADQEKDLFLTMSESKINNSRFIKRNWSYYDLQQKIIDKAKRENIIINLIDPYHTSQTCSRCGHYEAGQRESQSEFICKKCNTTLNADYNASRNIAKSTNIISKKEDSQFYKNRRSVKENEE